METESGAEFISETHVRHVMRYVKACDLLKSGYTNIADAACGTGYGTNLIARRYGPWVMGMDNSDEALGEARKNYPHLRFEKQNLMKFDNDTIMGFDAVVSIETIEHFNNAQIIDYLRTMKIILYKAGQLIISTPYCAQSGPSPVTKQHLWEFSLTDLETALTDGGFDVKAIYPERHEGKAGRLGYCMVDCVAR